MAPSENESKNEKFINYFSIENWNLFSCVTHWYYLSTKHTSSLAGLEPAVDLCTRNLGAFVRMSTAGLNYWKSEKWNWRNWIRNQSRCDSLCIIAIWRKCVIGKNGSSGVHWIWCCVCVWLENFWKCCTIWALHASATTIISILEHVTVLWICDENQNRPDLSKHCQSSNNKNCFCKKMKIMSKNSPSIQ